MDMNRKKNAAAALFVCCLGGMIAGGQADAGTITIRDGKWEMVTTMKGEKPKTETECIVKGKDDSIDEKVEPNDSCKEKRTITGNKLTMVQTCDSPEAGIRSEARMEMTYAKESYTGTMTTKITDKTGKTTVQTGTLSGRRIGACTP